MPDSVEQLRRRVAELDAEVSRYHKAFTEPGMLMFLDGRNEHGSHVIPSYPSNMPDPGQDSLDGYGEEILAAAEGAGYAVGDFIWVWWKWHRETDHDQSLEFVGVDAEFTKSLSKIRPALAGGSDGG